MFRPLSLLLLATINVSAAPTEDLCARAQGELKGRGCYCAHFGLYIDPAKENCLPAKINNAINAVNKLTGKKCQSDGLESMNPLSSPTLNDSADLCADPISVLCDERYNLTLKKIKNAEAAFDRLKSKAEQSTKIKKFIAAQSAGDLQTCSQLKIDAWRKCQDLTDEDLKNELFTPERRAKAEEIFKQAKGSVLKVLNEKKKDLEKSNSTSGVAGLEKMIEAIQETQLYFGAYHEKNPLTFNVSLKALIPSKDQKWTGPDVENNYRNTLYLEGQVLYVDEAPDTLFASLVHEFGHAIGPSSSRLNMNKSDAQNPFHTELSCLKSKASVHAQTGDANCFRALAAKYKTSDPSKAAKLLLTAQDIERNPDAAWVTPVLGEQETCQMGQSDEAFADWLATEAFALRDHTLSTISKPTVAGEFNPPISLIERLSKNETLLGFIAQKCNNMNIEGEATLRKDSHLDQRGQLEAIILNHPQLRLNLGCGVSQEPSKPMENEAKKNSIKPIYCGQAPTLEAGEKR